jgi:gamma-glutamylcyclotransferase (GGCT)/AIG2-like uncharacterized protein YtfP
VRISRYDVEQSANQQHAWHRLTQYLVDTPREPAILFVYGSLVDETRRQQVIGRRVDTAPATLGGYERGLGRYFYVRRRPGASTQGLLLWDLTSQDFLLLDEYEEVPHLYTREIVEVMDHSGLLIRCWAYLPAPFALGGSNI